MPTLAMNTAVALLGSGASSTMIQDVASSAHVSQYSPLTTRSYADD